MFRGAGQFQSYWLAICAITLAFASPISAQHSSSDFDSVCQGALSSPDPNSQKTSYCQAAQSSQKAAQASGLAWKIWVATGAVCAAACAASLAGMSLSQYACPGATIAASVSDAAITKNYLNALVGIMAAGGAYVINRQTNSALQNPGSNDPDVKPKPQTDVAACMLAANSAFMAFTNYNTQQSSLNSVKLNLQSAQSVDSNVPQQNLAGTSSGIIPSTTLSGSTNALGGGILTSSTIPGMNTTRMMNQPFSTGNCFGSRGYTSGMMTPSVITQCAVAADNKLPEFINSSRFPNDFKKATGMSLPEFVAKDSTPSKALVAAMSGPLSSAQSVQLSAAVKKMEQQISQNVPSSVYASGGRGGPRNSSDSSLNDMMNGMMGQFAAQMGGKTEGEGNQSGLSQVIFANQKTQNSPQIAEDTSLSLFDRITYRYYFVSNRMLEEIP